MAFRPGPIAVVGASVMDMISYVPRLPKLGETVLGSRFTVGFGGKGANQAVCAARLGAQVSLVTKLGKDDFGSSTMANFRDNAVDVSQVLFCETGSTGVAPITVDSQGANSIVVVMAANDALSPEDVQHARPVLSAASLLLCQLEIKPETSLAALRLGRELGVPTVLNTAGDPAAAVAHPELLELADVICPNQSEAELLTGQAVSSVAEAERAARVLAEKGARRHVIITLGRDGALWLDCSTGATVHVPGTADEPVDTVGAGDAFMGAFACFVASEGNSIQDAIRKANVVAGRSVTRPGTQTSYPPRADLPPELF